VTEPLVFREREGSITVTAAALTQLVSRAAGSVEGARVRRSRRAIEVSCGTGRASVSIELSAHHGLALHELARSVQERVADALGRASGLEVERVDVDLQEVV
jgi:uncharacterized alkaline shock family protein YloU